MKVTLEVEINSFTVPNFVTVAKKEGRAAEESIPLSALDSLTLDRLCSDFRNEVFRKAGKEQPPTCG